jgi:hypothetical protein
MSQTAADSYYKNDVKRLTSSSCKVECEHEAVASCLGSKRIGTSGAKTISTGQNYNNEY